MAFVRLTSPTERERERAIAAGLALFLRRLFPKLNVSVAVAAFGDGLRVDFVADRPASLAWCSIGVPWSSTPTDVATKVLRSAYPRGWAVP